MHVELERGNELPRRTKTERREAFLKLHPVCCFCGGVRPAVEQDHFPSRSLFADRAWPEGYEFPACFKCNHTTPSDEEVVAFLARGYPDPKPGSELVRFEAIARSLGQHRPDLMLEMRPTARQVRQELARRGISKPPGLTTAEIPFLNVSGPIVNAAVRSFGRKLFLALYYKEAGLVLPSAGGIAVRWYSNLQIHDGIIPPELGNVLPGFPKLVRANGDLSDQFFYRFGMVDSKVVGAFLAFFRESFAVLGFLARDAARLTPPVPPAEILAPFVWTSDR